MKTAGAALLILGAILGASARLKALRQDISALSDVLFMLDIMESELSASASALPVMALALEGRCRGQARAFLRALSAELSKLGEQDFASIWNGCVRNTLPSLEKTELTELERLGAVLGRCELGMQLRAIKRCSEHFRFALELSRRDYPQKQKLSLGLYMGGGLLLTILLL